MKKILVSALAAMSLVACMQEEIVTVTPDRAISFEGAYVENATRAAVDPSTTTASISGFDVWAFMNESNGTVLNDEDVKKVGGSWTYANTQYWTPLNKYYFAALAPMNSANVTETIASGDAAKLGLGTIDFTNVDGSEDLLYAATMVETPRYDDLKLNNMPPVKFQFSHLLSKVKFTFTNGFKTDNAYIVVRELKMVVPKTGTIDLAVENWWDNDDWQLGTETVDLAFGDVPQIGMGEKEECAKERLTIPAEADQVYNISFLVDLYMDQQLAYTFEKTSTVTGIALEMGKAYNFKATIDSETFELPEIEFDVVVKEWEMPYIDVEHPVVAKIGNVPYTSLQAAIDAVTESTTIDLVSDVEEDVTITQTKDINLVIDGQDKTFKGTMRVSGQSRYSDTETLTIKNVNFVNYTEEACLDMNWGTSNETRYAHNVTVEGCTFTVAGKGTHVAPAIDMYQPYNVVINNVEVTGAHSLLQVKGGHDGVAVSNVKVTDCKNGIAFGTHDGAVSVTNAEINTLGYGIRADGSVATTLTVENATINALRPIVVRKLTGSYNVALAGTNTLTAGDYYQVVLTKGDDEATYSAPTGAYTITGADAFKVYPTDASDRVATADQLAAALAGTQTEIQLESGAVIEGTFTVKRDVTITSFEGNPATIKGRVNVANCNPTFVGVNFDRNADSDAAWNTANGSSNCLQYKAVVMIYGATTNKVTFEKCNFYNNGGTHKSAITNTAVELVIDECYFEGRSSAIYTQANISMTNSTINYTGTNNVVLSINGVGDAGGKVIFKNNKVTGDNIFVLGQFLSTTGFGNGLYYFDVQGNDDKFDNIFFNTTRVANKEFAAGSITF